MILCFSNSEFAWVALCSVVDADLILYIYLEPNRRKWLSHFFSVEL